MGRRCRVYVPAQASPVILIFINRCHGSGPLCRQRRCFKKTNAPIRAEQVSVWTHLSSFIIDGSVSTKIYFRKLNQSLSHNTRLSAANDANEARLRLHFRPPPPDRLQNLGWKQNAHGPGWVANESGLRRRGENAHQLIHTGMKTSAAASHQPRLSTDEARRAVSHAAAIDRYRQPGSKEPRPAARLRPQTNKTA